MPVTWLIMIISIICVIICLILLLGKKLCDMATKTEVTQKYSNLIFTSEQKVDMEKTNNEATKWLKENAKEVEIISKDGLRLKGYCYC